MNLRKVNLKPENFIDFKPLLIRNVLGYELPSLDEISAIFSFEGDFRFQTLNDLEEVEKIYVIIDTKGQDAFGHWFFESAIWVPEILKLYSKYVDKIEFLLLNKKKYKEDVLNFFNVRHSYTAILPNITITCPPITSLNLNDHTLRYSNLLKNFLQAIEKSQLNIEKIYEHLLMPRQKKENLQVNDRHVDTENIELFFNAEDENFKIFNSDQSPSFDEQLKLVRSSKTLYVTDGSAFLVNGFIARNSILVVLGSSLVPNQSTKFEKMALITQVIESFNSVVFITSSDNKFTSEMVKLFLYSHVKFLPKYL
jgi:hypothetical protein